MARKRERWQRHQRRLDPRRLVFIDETWAKTNMTRTHGRSQRGERLVAKVPHGRWRTLTFIAALRHDRITAPIVFDQPINGETFTAYVEKALLPTLTPGDVVVLDNPSSHKGKAVRQAIRKAGAHLLFTPPYSPDLNPIEQMFFKLKRRCESRRAIRRCNPDAHRLLARLLLISRMRQLPRQLRLRSKPAVILNSFQDPLLHSDDRQ